MDMICLEYWVELYEIIDFVGKNSRILGVLYGLIYINIGESYYSWVFEFGFRLNNFGCIFFVFLIKGLVGFFFLFFYVYFIWLFICF